MKTLSEFTRILRSKNAGPLYITFDLIFPDRQTMEYVQCRLTHEAVAEAYEIPVESIRIIPYAVVNAIKITFPRKHISGSLEDGDIYGCQQHIPLSKMIIE